MAYQILFSFSRSSLAAFHIRATVRPSSRSSGPTSSAPILGLGAAGRDTGFCSGFVMRSTDSPLQPAACRLRLGGDNDPSRARRCASMFPTKTASYRRRAAWGIGAARVRGPCIMSGFTESTGRPLETDVREVATLITDERSDAVETSELRFEDGGRTREGGGGGGAGFPGCGRTIYGTTGVVFADRGEVNVDVVCNVVGVVLGRCGSLGGSGRLTSSPQSFDKEVAVGLITDDAETFSNDSSKLTLSGSRLLSVS